jgi:hypothetical protein
MDLLFIAITAGFFAATAALCAAFDRIRRRT